jgi:hypothetical protein
MSRTLKTIVHQLTEAKQINLHTFEVAPAVLPPVTGPATRSPALQGRVFKGLDPADKV